MESVIGLLGFIIVLVWAYHIEINTAKSKEALERIEKQLESIIKKETK